MDIQIIDKLLTIPKDPKELTLKLKRVEGFWQAHLRTVGENGLNSVDELLTLGIPKSTKVADGKQVLFSTGDFSRQAPATHLRHTFSGLAQASRALPASFWYQRFRTNRATILESGVVIR